MNAEQGNRNLGTPWKIYRIVGAMLIVNGGLAAVYSLLGLVTIWQERRGLSSHQAPLGARSIFQFLDPFVCHSIILIAGICLVRHSTKSLRAFFTATIMVSILSILLLANEINILLSAGFPYSPVNFSRFAIEKLQMAVLLLSGWLIARRMQRFDNAERLLGPKCNHCDYLMRGLNEPRCPECGRVYTLDEFHAL